MIVLLVPSLLPPPVLSELLQAHLITTEECKVLHDLGDVLRVLSSKPDAKDILKRHGLEDESKLNSGEQLTSSCNK